MWKKIGGNNGRPWKTRKNVLFQVGKPDFFFFGLLSETKRNTPKKQPQKKRRVQAQVRSPEGPPYLTLKPPKENATKKVNKKGKTKNIRMWGALSRKTKFIRQCVWAKASFQFWMFRPQHLQCHWPSILVLAPPEIGGKWPTDGTDGPKTGSTMGPPFAFFGHCLHFSVQYLAPFFGRNRFCTKSTGLLPNISGKEGLLLSWA